MIEKKLISNRDNYIQKLITENLYLAQMEVIEINKDDLSVTLKYGDNKYFKNCSLRGINLDIDDEDIYNVSIPEMNSKVWCLVWNNQVIIIKCYRPEETILKINNTEICIVDKSVDIKCNDIIINIDGKNNKVKISSDKLYINTDNEQEPIVKGDSLKQLLDKIIDWILNHQHQSTTPGSPVLPVLTTPTAINMVTEINIEKSNIDNIKSKKNFGA